MRSSIFLWASIARRKNPCNRVKSPATKFVIPTEFTRLVEPFTGYIEKGMGGRAGAAGGE